MLHYVMLRYTMLRYTILLVGPLKMNTTLEYSTEWSRRETVDVKRVLLTI
jgi:hypothetical protein